jgi:myo-inositol 2-dehydrogenase/D-chiro-inositol 1-dehydrogenase
MLHGRSAVKYHRFLAEGDLLMSDVRCGLIGYGAWGAHHARAIAAAPGARLTAIVARSPESIARANADHPAARIYQDHRQMLAAEELDLCDVVLPSDLHFTVGRDVLESGRHLLLEKPMALRVEDCARLVELARQRGRLLAIGHELRMSSLWGKVNELIDAGAIGQPLYALIELWRRPYRPGSGGWRYDIGRVGNWILEEPIHFFDLARWYFASAGEPVGVYATASAKRPDHPELHDNFSAIVTFPGGRYAVISQTLAGWEHHQTVKLTGTGGALWAAWSGPMDRTSEPEVSLKVQRGEQPVEQLPIERRAGEVYELVDLVASVVRAVGDDGPPPCSGEDGWWSTAMCLKAAESIASRTPMSFEARPK